MRITKGALAEPSVVLDERELGEINKFTRSPLKAEDVYCFAVLLCDNDVDRDFERFSAVPALQGRRSRRCSKPVKAWAAE